jgi:hypothetical protein
LDWDGRPREVEGGRVYTPHKALRRTADHLLDHLAEIQALLSEEPSIPDGWLASLVTTPADLAPFTADDLNEASQRLKRLAALYDQILSAAGEHQLDLPRSSGQTIREIVRHVASPWYAEQLEGPCGAPE